MATFEPDSWKPAVNTLTWFLMVTAIIGVFARLGTKYWIIRRWTADDYLSIASMVRSSIAIDSSKEERPCYSD
jgi:hypothetical protein